ncbi:MAG TPA: ABC transporter substrate-binding protein [Mycobacterium sp.]|nr:ABC transporter substrate-binding protein [Mycobacterium sp.]
MPSLKRQRSRGVTLTVAVVVGGLVAVGCGRSSSSTPSGTTSSAPASASASASANAIGKGDFGSEKKVCAPGPATGASGRGIVGKTIHLGVLADPGAAAAPGLEQEFFDTADGFTKWCNAAGGINGYQLVVDKLDAKLFNGGQQVIQACQRDFMLVGGGNALDATDVKPRLACKLGQIPAYTVSPEASSAGLQVSPSASFPTKYPVGSLRLLALAFPDTQQALGIAGSNLASLTPQGLRAQQAYQELGYKVTTVQPRPALVDNYRPWIEQMKQTGAKADFEITAQDPTPIFNAMNDTGFKPEWTLFSQTFYSSKSIAAAKSVAVLPNSYVAFSNLPWELADQFPVVAQAKQIMKVAVPSSNLNAFTDGAFNAWVLWAQSATACGSTLTQDCILQKASQHPEWTAGGLYPPVNTDPSVQTPTNCIVIMRLTKDGFVFDKKVTQPNTLGVYNCGADNIVTVKSFQTS